MKKIILVLTILWWSVTFMLVFSCNKKPQVVEPEPVITDWKVEVKYLDKTVDTIVIRGVNAPFLWIDEHVSVVRLDDSYVPYASYVKTINILNQQ